MTIKELAPSQVWNNFYQITRQPRPSKHEEKIRAFLLSWASEHGVEAFADETGNVIMPPLPDSKTARVSSSRATWIWSPRKTPTLSTIL